MRLLINIVIADADEAGKVGASSRPIDDWQGMEMLGVDVEKLAILQAVLTGQTFDEALAEYDPVYAESDEGPWVVKIPQAPLERLAALDEDVLEQVGAELAATEEFERDGWPVDEVEALLADLSALAGASLTEGKGLLLWMRSIAS